MDLPDESQDYGPYNRRHLLSAFEIAPQDLLLEGDEDSIIQKLLRLATVSAYVACRLSEQPSNADGFTVLEGLKDIRASLQDIELAAIAPPTAAKVARILKRTRSSRSSSPSQELLNTHPPVHKLPRKVRAAPALPTPAPPKRTVEPSPAALPPKRTVQPSPAALPSAFGSKLFTIWSGGSTRYAAPCSPQPSLAAPSTSGALNTGRERPYTSESHLAP
ncbi:hypothetical protein BN946_scf184706.g7 [Trametes cinnabarina]|uniref:Uncharacterized protein n=1 Tax=Pycnoporus cinnabarinus TaxID=5643 RepID=A0A060SR59_PYCCI|nr:hypothetical protein BN946_scf184706.g7 [Trametes cinnabarina]